ncbi:hypothetical protein Ddye_027624 [Dipteronia dyeriana]|uniref:Uncharacterized protein n=1 Tax=Dipteronia dyeriana TaxID=168575 RepID=A0AAD9TQE6_9ROSI|nr:hypothetical protein Ddye_027624 [Dipteronia dyeriana]
MSSNCNPRPFTLQDHPLPKEASCHRKLLSSVAVAESSSPSPGHRPRSCLQFSRPAIAVRPSLPRLFCWLCLLFSVMLKLDAFVVL